MDRKVANEDSDSELVDCVLSAVVVSPIKLRGFLFVDLGSAAFSGQSVGVLLSVALRSDKFF